MSSHRPTPAFLAVASTILLILAGACTAPGAGRPGRLVSVTGVDSGGCLAAPCLTIGYAVKQAHVGDTISVDSGTFHEAVHVTKRLTLLGHHSVIDAAWQTAPANGVLITGSAAAGSAIQGFTIRNAGLEGIYVHQSSNIVIADNIVEHNDAYGPSNPICQKYQSDCGEAIHLQAVTGAVVRHNTVRHNNGGILLTDEDGPTAHDTLADNTIADNPGDCGITLASHWLDTLAKVPAAPTVAGVYQNVIVRNTVTRSGGVGIGIFAAGPAAAAWGNVVANNTASHNGMPGIAIHAHTKPQNVDGNVIRDNVVSDNGTDVESVVDRKPSGISAFSTLGVIHGMTIGGNTIRDEHFGITLQHVDSVAGLKSNAAANVTQPVSIH